MDEAFRGCVLSLWNGEPTNCGELRIQVLEGEPCTSDDGTPCMPGEYVQELVVPGNPRRVELDQMVPGGERFTAAFEPEYAPQETNGQTCSVARERRSVDPCAPAATVAAAAAAHQLQLGTRASRARGRSRR